MRSALGLCIVFAHKCVVIYYGFELVIFIIIKILSSFYHSILERAFVGAGTCFSCKRMDTPILFYLAFDQYMNIFKKTDTKKYTHYIIKILYTTLVALR